MAQVDVTETALATALFKNTALITAVKNGDQGAVARLLCDGASPDAVGPQGWTAVSSAAYEGHANVVRVLAERGGNVETPDKDGATPVFMAAANGHVEVVGLLRELGGNVETPSQHCVAPVYIAAHRICLGELLRELGANVETPMGWRRGLHRGDEWPNGEGGCCTSWGPTSRLRTDGLAG